MAASKRLCAVALAEITAEFFFRDKECMLEDQETMLSCQAHQPTQAKSFLVKMSSECANFCKHTMTFTTNKHSYEVCKECIEVHDDAGSRVYMCNTCATHLECVCASVCVCVLVLPLVAHKCYPSQVTILDVGPTETCVLEARWGGR